MSDELKNPAFRDSLPGTARILADQTRYQLRLLVRSPRALMAGMLLPVMLLLLGRTGTDASPQLGLVAGPCIFGVISIAYSSQATSLVNAREAGILRRWRLSPLPSWCFFAGLTIASLILAGLSAMVTLAFAWLIGTPVALAPVLVALVPIALGVLAWSALGTAVTRLISNVSSAYPILAATYLPLIFLSGGVGPASANLPGWVNTLVAYLPAQPMIDAVARALGRGSSASLLSLRDLAVLAAWAAMGLLISLRFFSWNPRPATRGHPATARRRRRPRECAVL